MSHHFTEKVSLRDYPFISVIVPVLNAENIIEKCIQSLLDLDYPKSRHEIIIVDNNSTDNTRLIIEKYPVKLLLETKKSSYIARNTGIRASKGEILVFTDSDCIVDKNWLTNIIKKFDDPKVGGIGGKLVGYSPKTIVEKYLTATSYFNAEATANLAKPYFVTANVAYKRSIMEEISLFDESFTSWGDADLSYRIVGQGYKIVYEPEAVVYHKHRSSLKDLFFQNLKNGRGRVKLYKKHSEKNHLRIWSYVLMAYYLLLKLPWRIITVFLQKKNDRSLYIIKPVCEFTITLGYKLGMILGSIKFKAIYL